MKKENKIVSEPVQKDRCSSAKRYRGYTKPKCGKGKPCLLCDYKFDINTQLSFLPNSGYNFGGFDIEDMDNFVNRLDEAAAYVWMDIKCKEQ